MPEERSSREFRGRRPRWLYLAGSVVALGLAYGPLLRPGHLLAMGDLPFFHLPLRTLFRTALQGGIPWWNGAIHGGQPILSNPNYASFYPPSWLALVVPVPLALHLILMLHAAWAFAGAWSLARHLGCRRRSALLAAIGFGLSSSLVSSTSILTLFCGFAWLPWIVLWGYRTTRESTWYRPACLLACGLAAQLLAGEPVACILSGVALLGLALDSLVSRRRTALRLAVPIVLAMAVGAVQLVPTAVRLAESPRDTGELGSSAGLRSMHPARFAELAIAHPLGDPHLIDSGLFFGQRLNEVGFPYIPSIYPGLLVTILAIAGLARPGLPLRAAWITMLAVGAGLAIGRHNPVYLEGLAHLPVLDQVRYPEKYVLAAMAALPFAAALHWERLLDQVEDSGRRLGVLLAAVATALLALLAALFLVLPESPVWLASSHRELPVTAETAGRISTWARNESLVALAVAGGVWAVLGLGRRGRAASVAVVSVALLAGDLAWQNRHALQLVPTETIFRPEEPVSELSTEDRIFTDLSYAPGSIQPLRDEREGPDAYWSGLETAHPYVATLWGHSYALNFDWDLMLTRPARRALAALDEDWPNADLGHRFLGAWNVGTILHHRPLQDVLRDRFEGRPDPRLEAKKNPQVLPLVRAVPKVTFHADPETALAAARADNYAVGDLGHWIGTPHRELGAGAASPVGESALDVVRHGWSEIEIETGSAAPQLVQLAVTYDRGWQATAGERPVAVHETATGQIGIEVPANQRVVVRYRDRSLWIGVALSLAGLLVAAALSTRGHRRQLGNAAPR